MRSSIWLLTATDTCCCLTPDTSPVAIVVAVPAENGRRYGAVLAADTLLPGGNGQGIPADEQAVLWDIARALGTALDATESMRLKDASSSAGAEAVAALTSQLEELRAAAPAQLGVPEGRWGALTLSACCHCLAHECQHATDRSTRADCAWSSTQVCCDGMSIATFVESVVLQSAAYGCS